MGVAATEIGNMGRSEAQSKKLVRDIGSEEGISDKDESRA